MAGALSDSPIVAMTMLQQYCQKECPSRQQRTAAEALFSHQVHPWQQVVVFVVVSAADACSAEGENQTAKPRHLQRDQKMAKPMNVKPQHQARVLLHVVVAGFGLWLEGEWQKAAETRLSQHNCQCQETKEPTAAESLSQRKACCCLNKQGQKMAQMANSQRWA